MEYSKDNCYYWSQENPYWFRETQFQNTCGELLCDGMELIINDHYEGTLTGQICVDFLRYELIIQLVEVPWTLGAT